VRRCIMSYAGRGYLYLVVVQTLTHRVAHTARSTRRVCPNYAKKARPHTRPSCLNAHGTLVACNAGAVDARLAGATHPALHAAPSRVRAVPAGSALADAASVPSPACKQGCERRAAGRERRSKHREQARKREERAARGGRYSLCPKR